MTKKILIVEDEPDIMTLTTIRVKHFGYDVMQAFSAEEALASLPQERCDLILLDLFLPNMQGGELCKMLKSQEAYKHIPIIIFTVSTQMLLHPEKLKEMGAEDCIIKPYDPKMLLSKIKQFIG